MALDIRTPLPYSAIAFFVGSVNESGLLRSLLACLREEAIVRTISPSAMTSAFISTRLAFGHERVL